MIGYARAAVKAPLTALLRRNPLSGTFADGPVFRNKMRAIHRIAPHLIDGPILEIGGGRSGLTRRLYPSAELVTLHAGSGGAEAAVTREPGRRMVQGEPANLPFPERSFAAVTLFDLEAPPADDVRIAQEALRVLQPGGVVLLTAPYRLRRQPFRDRILSPSSPPEAVRTDGGEAICRSYTEGELDALFGSAATRRSSFARPLLGASHGPVLSRLPRLVGRALAAALPLPDILWPRQSGRRAAIALRYVKAETSQTSPGTAA